MRTVKFSIGWLRQTQFSSIVNEVIKTISIFFHENKLQIKPKPTNKTKITKQKNKIGNNVSRTKTFKKELFILPLFLPKISS